MLQPRYVLYSFYEDGDFKKFIYWDTKEQTFAISENRKAGIIKSSFIIGVSGLIDALGIKLSLGSYINKGINIELLILIPLITLLFFKILNFIQNNKEKDFYDLNINNTDTLMKIIYKTRKNMVKDFVEGEFYIIIGLFILMAGYYLKIPGTQQLLFIVLFYIIEAMAIIDPFIKYFPGRKIAKELKKQYPLVDSYYKKDNKKWY